MPAALLDPAAMAIEPRTLDAPTALVSIDVESDYGTGLDEALSKIPRLIDLLAELRVPLTAFVEGRLFERSPALCRRLVDAGVDVQLHCYDHRKPGDTPSELRRGAAAYAEFCGRPPAGYRAHTYRLSRALYETLLELGFAWDSSLQRGWGQGSQRDPAFAKGDYLVFDGRLLEFPIGRWRHVPLPFNHTYRLLAKAPGDALLWTLAGPGRLAVYNMHMTDLVRSGSLKHAVRSPRSRALHRYLWLFQGENTFLAVRSLVARLRRRRYEFLSTNELWARVSR